MNNKYYLYRHIRLDKNEPFYIGIGSKPKPNKISRDCKTEYTRAYDFSQRNNFWKNIVSKTKYKVEILLESHDKEFIKQKEVEFIKLYGRKNLDTGTLCNLTDGGDGNVNLICSDLQKQKSKERMVLMNKSREYFKKPYQSVKVLNIKTGKIFCSMEDAYKEYNKYSSNHFRLMLSNKSPNKTDFIKLN